LTFNKFESILFPAKLLLFGEHSILKGSQALAMLFANFSGRWQQLPPEGLKEKANKQLKLPAFFDYLKSLQNDGELLCQMAIPVFGKALEKGLYFDSNIPVGYGLGSSGALCAAIYEGFCENKKRVPKTLPKPKQASVLIQLKKELAQLESFFHGSSSGIDPLICYVRQPVLIGGVGQIEIVSVPESKPDGRGSIFLLDTGISRQTGPFVEHFLAKCREEFFGKRCQSELVPLTDDAIHAFLETRWELLFEMMHEIGLFQFRYLQKMIPPDFKNCWLEGLEGDLFKLKLCGAGGGGFLLGMTQDFEKTRKKLEQFSLTNVLRF